MPRRRRALLRALVLAAACAGLSVSLSGCIYFSNGFWTCLATDDKAACDAMRSYLAQTPTDTDGDGTVNVNDRCPNAYGGWETGGCPDRDDDDVADDVDRCPEVKGDDGLGCPQQGAPPSDTTPPSAPAGLRANVADASVFLNWEDNTESDLRGYTVERATTPGGPYTELTSHWSNSEYVDRSPTPGPNYYIVKAEDHTGNISARSTEVSATYCPPGFCLASASRARSYRATVTGGIASKGTLSSTGGNLTGRGIIFAGTLTAARGAPAGLRRATWRARIDFSLPASGTTATATGVALARFGTRDRLCLRFTQSMIAGAGGARLLKGNFTAIGGSGRARALAAATRFTGGPAPAGAWTLRATGQPGKRLPRRMPPACRGL